MSEFLRKVRWLWNRSRRETELERELRFHLEREAEERSDDGLSPEEAKSAARRDLGNVALVAEDTRAAWTWTWAEQLRHDVRYAVRMLAKAPGFTAAAVLSLALGIGANTAIFTLLNAIVLRLLPVSQPEQLVQFAYMLPMFETNPNNWNSWFGYPHFERFQARSKTLSGVFGGTSMRRVNVGHGGSSGVAKADAYTGNFFAVLGLAPTHGRFFSAADDTADAAVAVLSHSYWRTRFGGDASVVGSAITINQLSFTVIGITPPDFNGISVGAGPDVWVPLRAMDRWTPDSKARARRWTEAFTSWMLIAGRLRPGVSLSEAQAELDVIHRQLIAEQVAAADSRTRENMQRFARDSRLLLRPAATGMFSGIRDTYALPLKLLMAVAGIVLLVACANLANLLLARASHRRREIAVRLALGAGRGRLIRQLLTESILLSALGGILGLAIASWGSSALIRMISPGDTPLPIDVQPDWRIFMFAAAVSLLTGILFGLAPALRATRVDPAPAIKEGARQTSRSSNVLDRTLVVVQIALSVVLITGAGLLVRTVNKLWDVNVGYDRQGVLMFSVDAKLAGHSTERAGAIYREILDRLRTLPEVEAAGASIVRPVDDQFYLIDRVDEIDGRKVPQSETIRVAWNATSPGYFATISTPVLLGRDFDERDVENAPKVVIVNESLAARAFPGQNPIGHRLGLATVIGVVKDSHYNGVRDQPRPVLYHPLFQYGTQQAFQWGFVSFELRYRGDRNLSDGVRREVASVDRNLPIFLMKTLQRQSEQSLLKERLLAMLSSFFGFLALMLAAVGLAGLMAYAVATRTAEIGIRLALGAQREQVIWLILRETLYLTFAGIAAGIPLALWAAQYAKSLLFGVNTADPLTIAITLVTLLVVAIASAFLPVRRAVRVDPAVALRYE